MCRYCSKLKQINENDRKSLLACIQSWRRRDRRMQDLLEALVSYVSEIDDPVVSLLVKSAKAELSKTWIGK